ncbi:uncharacterized protein LOC107036860 [Diachasma alloeum]|uniref:uncharacterized protein LOC107036860 n=1 Tax=Diachasma alloeum TaxID=454923 RepID=UPI0007381061|nr:uncharacterized protein LOC107036860 [Diachasma alloeum]
MYKRSYIGRDFYQLWTRRNMNLVMILGIASVAAATEVLPHEVVQPEVPEGKKIEKRSHELWEPWAPAISSHYTYSAPVISKLRVGKPGWSSLLSSGWSPQWYVGSPVIVKSSGWSGGWNSGWKW